MLLYAGVDDLASFQGQARDRHHPDQCFGGLSGSLRITPVMLLQTLLHHPVIGSSC